MMNFVDRDLNFDIPFLTQMAAVLYGVVFFSQNTALFFNIARWYVLLKRRDILLNESREDYLALTNAFQFRIGVTYPHLIF